jgi:two-component system sensor histidine kinase UhpB
MRVPGSKRGRQQYSPPISLAVTSFVHYKSASPPISSSCFEACPSGSIIVHLHILETGTEYSTPYASSGDAPPRFSAKEETPGLAGNSPSPLKIQLVEDDPSFGALLEAILNEADYGRFEAIRVTRLSEALDLLGKTNFDAVLLDLSLPDSNGLATLTSLHTRYPKVPIVVLTGTRDENLAIDSLRNGAQDYIVKGQLDNDMLVRSIRYAIERNRVEQELVESESRYRALMEQASDGIFVLDPSGRLSDVNPIGSALLGYRREELLGMTQTDLLVPLTYLRSTRRDEEFRHGAVAIRERIVRRKDGTEVTVEISAKLLDDGRILAIARDITRRKKAEQELQAHVENQANLLHQLLNAQEDERRRLSMDIHDGPLQSLGVSLLALDRSMRRLDRGEYDAGRQELATLRASLSNTVSEVRAVLADLSLELLTQYGLRIALRNHIERFSEVTGIQVDLNYVVRRKLGADVVLLMYRLAQEALANIRKHSRAERASVTLRVSHGVLHMTIKDNGRGFDPQAVLQMRYAGEKLGLRSMRERIELAGGLFDIKSAPGQGTTLDFSCPLPGPKPRKRKK